MLTSCWSAKLEVRSPGSAPSGKAVAAISSTLEKVTFRRAGRTIMGRRSDQPSGHLVFASTNARPKK